MYAIDAAVKEALPPPVRRYRDGKHNQALNDLQELVFLSVQDQNTDAASFNIDEGHGRLYSSMTLTT
jgi:hypothetical protein